MLDLDSIDVSLEDYRSNSTENDESDRWAVTVRPPEEIDDDPRAVSERLFASLHGHGRLSFEIHSDGEDVELQVVTGTQATAETVARHVRSELGAWATVRPASVPIDEDDPLAAAEFEISKDVIYPLETAETADSEVGQLHHILDTFAEDDVRGCYQVVAEPVEGNWTARRARSLPESIPDEERDVEEELKRAGVAFVPLVGLSVYLSPWPLETAFLAGCALVMAATIGEGVCIPQYHSASEIAREHRDRTKERHGARSTTTKRAEETADVMIEQGAAPGWKATIRLVVAGDRRLSSTDHRDRLVAQVEQAFSSTTTGQELTATLSSGSDARTQLDHVRARHLSRPSLGEIVRRLLGKGTRKELHVGPGEFAGLANFPDRDGGGESGREFATSRAESKALPDAAPAFAMPAVADGGQTTDYLLDNPSVVESGRHADHGEVEIKAKDDGDYYAGDWLREITENATRDSNIVLGTTEDGDEEMVSEVAIDEDHLNQHMFLVGASGSGKTTLAEYLVQQYAHAGRGFCVIDPHNDFVDGIRRQLPDHRKDDVILVDPEGQHDRTVTINFLDVELSKDHPEYEAAVNAAVSDLVGVLRQGSSNVGDRMEDAVRTVGRGMIRSEQDYTLLDMQRLMTEPERRETFAKRMHEEGREHIARAAEGVAELSNEDLSPVSRLFNEWVMSPVSRQIIEQTESSFSFAEAVENDHIILFRGDLSDDNLARQYATAVYRGVMRAAEDRDEEGRQNTYPVIIDETDDIYTPEMQLGDDLGNARKYGVSLTLMTQYPKSLKPIQDSLETNCKTFVAYSCPSKKQARPIASMYGCDTSDIQSLGNYVAQIQIDIDGERSGPYRTDSPAPVPPVRTEETAVEEIDEPSLERFGVDPTDTTTQEEVEADGGEEPDPLEAFLAAAVEGGVLESGEHYTFVYEDTPRERLRINPSKSIDALDAEGLDHPQFEAINDHTREAVEDDDTPVIDHGQYTPDIGNCLGVDLDRVDHPRIDVEAGDF